MSLDSSAELGRIVGSAALQYALFNDANEPLLDTRLGELSAASLASKLNQFHTRTDISTRK